METGPDTLTEEQTAWLAMRAACLSEDNFDLEALRNLPPPRSTFLLGRNWADRT